MNAWHVRDQDMRNRHRRFYYLLAVVVCIACLGTWAADGWARSSGGRYGGRSGFSQNRGGFGRDGGVRQSSPPTGPYGSPPQTYTSPYPSPGFGYFPFFLPFLGWGGGMGGGFGFGGVIALVLVLGIVVVLGKVLLQNLATARRYRPGRASAGQGRGERYATITWQLGLLSTARELQRELQALARSASTDTTTGLASALQDLTVALSRYRDYWKYGAVQVQHPGSLDEAERAFNLLVAQERAKLSAEVTVNVDGVRKQASTSAPTPVDEVGRYLVVTLIVATGYPEFTAYPTPSLQELEGTLQRLGTLLAADLLALEVIWSPENPDDTLTEDELLTEYPDLSRL